jgi:lipopolysaccharide/colanic/teichoic acid biosynthesis glycosyltransferase
MSQSTAVLEAPTFDDTLEKATATLVKPRRKKPRPAAVVSTAAAAFPGDLAGLIPEGNLEIGYRIAKRAIDVVGAGLILLLLSPLMLATLILLTFTTRGQPLYYQLRAGHLGRPFRMWKFRTMRLDADKLQHLVKNEASGPVFKNRRDPRITLLGRFLRKFSIDETPQLFAVLAGQMSLVGPRPLPLHEMANAKPWQRRRLAVVPGLTCLWQVSGRSDIGFEEWAKMDVWYVENQGLWTDLWLLVKTPLTVVTGKGAY